MTYFKIIFLNQGILIYYYNFIILCLIKNIIKIEYKSSNFI